MEHAKSSFALRKPQEQLQTVASSLLCWEQNQSPMLLEGLAGSPTACLLLGTAVGSGCRLGNAVGEGPISPSDLCHIALSKTSSAIDKCAYPAGGCNIWWPCLSQGMVGHLWEGEGAERQGGGERDKSAAYFLVFRAEIPWPGGIDTGDASSHLICDAQAEPCSAKLQSYEPLASFSN